MAKQYGDFTVSLPGEEYLWQPDEMTVGECNQQEFDLRMTFQEWIDAIDDRRAVPTQWLIWFLRRKAGNNEERVSVEFPIRKLVLLPVPKDDPATTSGSETTTSSTSSEPDTSTAPISTP